jgi:hypothetical protein
MKKIFLAAFAIAVMFGTIIGYAPSRAQAFSSDEAQIVADYMAAAPKLPKHSSYKKAEATAIMLIFEPVDKSNSFADVATYLSAQSRQMFSQTPELIKELDNSPETITSIKPRLRDIKVYTGGKYAVINMRGKNNVTHKIERQKFIFVKEDGVWKLDFIQTMKAEL